jgi:hypothetical protein
MEIFIGAAAEGSSEAGTAESEGWSPHNTSVAYVYGFNCICPKGKTLEAKSKFSDRDKASVPVLSTKGLHGA